MSSRCVSKTGVSSILCVLSFEVKGLHVNSVVTKILLLVRSCHYEQLAVTKIPKLRRGSFYSSFVPH
jgi:hypothetical protein